MTSWAEHPLFAFGEVGAMLLRTLQSERLSPSYLFEGTDPDALEEAAVAFASGILTGAPPGSVDPDELGRVLDGRHPDLHRLTKDKATVISVTALAPVLRRAYTTPLEGRHQVFLVTPADAMEAQGIARYLKALEEPPPGTVFILLTGHAERLPETVLSRCRRVRFAPWPEDRIAERLEADGADAEMARLAGRYAAGSLGRARRFLDCEMGPLVQTLCEAADDAEPRVAETAERVLAAIQQRAAAWAASEKSEVDRKRQNVRILLGDLLRALCIEARDRAAGRSGAHLRDVDPERALDLLSAWGALASAVFANVTPALIVIETLAALRRPRSAGAALLGDDVR